MQKTERFNPNAIRGSGLATAATVLFGLTGLINLGLLCTVTIVVYYVMTQENFVLVQIEPIWRGVQAFLYVQALAVLVANGVFMIWLYIVHKDLHKSGARLEYSSHWAITGFFVPFLNFVRPFQVVRDVWRAGRPVSATSLPSRTPVVIRLWWEFVVVAFLYGLAGNYILGADQVEGSGILLMWYLIDAAACALAIAVVRLIERSLHRAEEVAPVAAAGARGSWPALADVGVLVLVALVSLAAYWHAEKTVMHGMEVGASNLRKMSPPPSSPAAPVERATGEETQLKGEERIIAPVEVPTRIEGVVGGVVGGEKEGRVSAPPPPPPPQRIRMGSIAAESLLISKIPPVYPELAKRARVEGTVTLSLVIDKDGKVRDVQVLKGNPLLTQAAIDAVKQWQYRPFLLNGEPVEVQTLVSVDFKVQE